MTKRNVLYAVGAIVVVLSTLWMVRAPDPAPASTATDTDTTNTLTAPAPPPTVTTSPIVQAHEAYTAFQQHSRRFFSEADQLDEQKRQAEMRQLLDGTNRYEAEGKLVPMEALVLKLALLRYSSSGDDDYKIKAKMLIDQYKAQSDLREQAWLTNPDPQFVEYKRQEQDIVREVMAMTVIPDGLSRDEYLRQRLEQARIATMGGGNGP